MPPNYKTVKFDFNIITPYSITIEAVDENYARDHFEDLLTQGELIENSKSLGIGFIDDSKITCHQEYRS